MLVGNCLAKRVTFQGNLIALRVTVIHIAY